MPRGADDPPGRSSLSTAPRAAAREDFIRASVSPGSTEYADEMLRLFADAFPPGGMLELAADRLVGDARKPGRKPLDDDELVAAIEERRDLHGAGTIRAVAHARYPGNKEEEDRAVWRLQRKVRQRKSGEL